MKPVRVLNSDGTLSEAVIGRAAKDVFTPWLEYVVKGLAMALTDRFLADAVFEVRAYEGANFDKLIASIDPFEYVVSLGRHTKYSYDPMRIGNAYGLWVFRFYDGLGFTVLCLPVALSAVLEE